MNMSGPLDLDQPEWPDVLRAVQAELQERIHVALPAVVRSYDTDKQTASVQCTVLLRGNPVPPLDDVPVAWPGGAAGFLHVPLASGDPLLVVFSEEDFSGWWDTGAVSAPRVLERHGLHAMAIPGLRRAKAPLAVTGGHVTLAATDALHLGSDTATAAIALATLVDAQLSALKAAIASAAASESGASGLGGMGFLQAALASWPSSTAATKVKAV